MPMPIVRIRGILANRQSRGERACSSEADIERSPAGFVTASTVLDAAGCRGKLIGVRHAVIAGFRAPRVPGIWAAHVQRGSFDGLD
jgi:hypothetical protein